jgi:hypothetical protein
MAVEGVNKVSDGSEREVWLRTNEIEEFIDAIEHTARLAGQVKDDVKVWKWLIIALHSALQGACVCALRGHDTAGVTMLTKKSWKKVWHWLDVESRNDPHSPMPAERLASLKDLFARVRDPELLPAPHTLRASTNVVADIDKLNRLRNDFIHFVPRGLFLELSGMPRIVTHAADAIEHLAVVQPSFWHHLRQPDRDRIGSALASLRNQVTAWANSMTQVDGAS